LSDGKGPARMSPVVQRTLSVASCGRRLGTREEGRRFAESVNSTLAALPPAGLLVVDLARIEVLGGSFADEAIGEPLARMTAGDHPDRYLLLRSPSVEILEDLDLKLRARRLAMLAGVGQRVHWRILGSLAPFLQESLGWLLTREMGTSQDLAAGLGVSSEAAAVRLRRLARQRLAHLVPESLPGGGVRYQAISLPSLAKTP